MPEQDVNVDPEGSRPLDDQEAELVSGGSSDDPGNPVNDPTDPIPPDR